MAHIFGRLGTWAVNKILKKYLHFAVAVEFAFKRAYMPRPTIFILTPSQLLVFLTTALWLYVYMTQAIACWTLDTDLALGTFHWMIQRLTGCHTAIREQQECVWVFNESKNSSKWIFRKYTPKWKRAARSKICPVSGRHYNTTYRRVEAIFFFILKAIQRQRWHIVSI